MTLHDYNSYNGDCDNYIVASDNCSIIVEHDNRIEARHHARIIAGHCCVVSCRDDATIIVESDFDIVCGKRCIIHCCGQGVINADVDTTIIITAYDKARIYTVGKDLKPNTTYTFYNGELYS